MAHHPNHPQHHEHQGGKKSTPIHKDWRAWTAIVLMLGAMLMYIFTMDESLGPDGQIQPEMGEMAE